MGGMGSVPYPRYSCCIRPQNPNRCKENHSSTPKIKGHKHNLSAAFNMADMGNEINIELIDINRATEEELMTLPGINRQTARNIVEYRKQIGAYKRVEDLALVSGVGATKLTHIRMEICVGRKKTSQNSSPNSSKADLSMQDDISRASSKSQARQGTSYNMVNINTCNVFQLMKVPGLSQFLAENVVAYRDKKGQFRHIDELLKVRGIKKALLSAIRPYLVLHDANGINVDSVHMNGTLPTSQSSQPVAELRHARKSSQTLSLPTRPASTSILGSQEDLISLYGPLLRKSFRNKKRPVLFRKNGRHIVRLASWNLHKCDLQKAENPGVKEVVAMTILENGFSLVAVQNIIGSEALDKLCEELNFPTIPNVKKWNGHHGSWKACLSSQIADDTQICCGFLYDVSRDIEFCSIDVVDHCVNNDKVLHRKPVVAVFKVLQVELCIVNVDWEPHQPTTLLGELLEAATYHTKSVTDVIIVGGFNHQPEVKDFDILRNKGYKCLFQRDDYTDISTHNPEGTRCCGNIWINPSASILYTGQHDIIRDGLTSPWIPDGWGWGGVVSPQCPLWLELYVELPKQANTVTSPPPPSLPNITDDTDEDEFVDAPEDITS